MEKRHFAFQIPPSTISSTSSRNSCSPRLRTSNSAIWSFCRTFLVVFFYLFVGPHFPQLFFCCFFLSFWWASSADTVRHTVLSIGLIGSASLLELLMNLQYPFNHLHLPLPSLVFNFIWKPLAETQSIHINSPRFSVPLRHKNPLERWKQVEEVRQVLEAPPSMDKSSKHCHWKTHGKTHGIYGIYIIYMGTLRGQCARGGASGAAVMLGFASLPAPRGPVFWLLRTSSWRYKLFKHLQHFATNVL